MLSKTAAITLLAAALVSAEPVPQNVITSIPADCIPDASLLSGIAGVPTAAPDVLSAAAGYTGTDPCGVTSVLTGSLSAEYASYTSRFDAHQSSIAPFISSHLSDFVSFYSSAAANPVCAPYSLQNNLAGLTATSTSSCGGAAATNGGSSSPSATSKSGSGSTSNSATPGAGGTAVVLIGGLLVSWLAVTIAL